MTIPDTLYVLGWIGPDDTWHPGAAFRSEMMAESAARTAPTRMSVVQYQPARPEPQEAAYRWVHVYIWGHPSQHAGDCWRVAMNGRGNIAVDCVPSEEEAHTWARTIDAAIRSAMAESGRHPDVR